MVKRNILQIVLFILLLHTFTLQSFAEVPTDKIRVATDKLIEIVTDQELMAMERDTERRKLIRDAVDQIFDWEAFSRRALGKYWRKRSLEEKKEFIDLFSRLLEQNYMDKTRQYAGEKVVFLDEIIDGKYGVVKTEILLKSRKKVEVFYKVRLSQNGWFVYDIQVEGFSLVDNFRRQFNSVILRDSYAELVNQLKKKVESD